MNGKLAQHINSYEIQGELLSDSVEWIKPPASFLRCNTDTAFFVQDDIRGFGAIENYI